MKIISLATMTLAFCFASATGLGKPLPNDPLTGLPLIPASLGSQPVKMPDSTIGKCKTKGDFYSLRDIKMDAAAAWLSSHLGYESGRTQVAFFNSDRTVVIFLTGDKGAEGENTNAYAVAYETYQPGLAEKTINSVTHGKMVCP
jgi:hypothetical protein